MEEAEPTERSPLVGDTGVSTSVTPRRPRDQTQIRPYGVLALLIFIVSIILIIVFFPHNHPESGVEDEIISPHELTENIFQHLNAFNLIAQGQEHDLSRGKSYSSLFTVVNNSLFDKENYATFGDLPRSSRSIINGYNESAAYITDQLKKHTQCNVKLQSFKVPIWQMFKEAELNVTFAHENDINMVGDEKENYAKKSAALAYQSGVDFRSMRYGGQSTRLEDQHVFYVNEFGCSDYGWVGIENKVALIQEGGKCGFWDAAYRAEKKGATAVIFFNSPNRKGLILSRVRLSDWQEGDPLMTIPVIAASYSLGQLLIYAKNVRVDLQTFTNIKVVDTYNIICDLNDKGRKEDTIVLGAHLDSVPTGPGIVDNASGSSVLLEILLALERAYFKPKNHLVFAWWAAEEIGLLGSRHYVRELVRKGENDNVAMNLNFDMLGSPNFVPFILQGEDAPSDIRNASIKIRNMFQAFFVAARTPYEFTDMIFGSDFLPFLQHGIPSGGIFTGAGDIKSEDERRTFGGLANAPYDPCYHQACDTIENVSHEAIETMAQAALFAITRFSKKVNLRQYLGAPEVDE